jgi:hypothetical protein
MRGVSGEALEHRCGSAAQAATTPGYVGSGDERAPQPDDDRIARQRRVFDLNRTGPPLHAVQTFVKRGIGKRYGEPTIGRRRHRRFHDQQVVHAIGPGLDAFVDGDGNGDTIDE